MELEGTREFRGGATRETPLLTVPLFHATGLLSGFVLPMHTAQKVVIMYKWNALKALALIQEERVTGVSRVPAVIQDLLSHPDFDHYATDSLIRVSAAGATMSGAVFDLSPASAGIVSPITQMRFMDANGDVGRIDEDGFLHITGRIKEVAIRGGENIYPGEIEQAVYELPQVKENVAFGVPDEAMGEELALVLHLNPGASLSEKELRAYLKDRLASHKVPRHIRFSNEPLPQNASGKLHKLNARAAFLAEA